MSANISSTQLITELQTLTSAMNALNASLAGGRGGSAGTGGGASGLAKTKNWLMGDLGKGMGLSGIINSPATWLGAAASDIAFGFMTMHERRVTANMVESRSPVEAANMRAATERSNWSILGDPVMALLPGGKGYQAASDENWREKTGLKTAAAMAGITQGQYTENRGALNQGLLAITNAKVELNREYSPENVRFQQDMMVVEGMRSRVNAYKKQVDAAYDAWDNATDSDKRKNLSKEYFRIKKMSGQYEDMKGQANELEAQAAERYKQNTFGRYTVGESAGVNNFAIAPALGGVPAVDPSVKALEDIGKNGALTNEKLDQIRDALGKNPLGN